MRKAVLVPKAKVKSDAAALINLIQTCDRFHTLPNPGGLFNQDYLFVDVLHQYLRWENERDELDKQKAKNAVPTS